MLYLKEGKSLARLISGWCSVTKMTTVMWRGGQLSGWLCRLHGEGRLGMTQMSSDSMSLGKLLKSPCSQFLSLSFFFLKGGRWDIVEIPFKSNFWGKFLAEWDIFETYDPFTSRCTKKSSHTVCSQISLSPCIWSYEEPSFRSLRKTLDITITLQLELWLNVVWRPEKQHYILCLLF